MAKYQYILKGLDCANCANKIQAKLSKTEGLKNVNVNFSTLRLTYETEIVSKQKVQEIVHEIEPEVTLIDIKQKEDSSNKNMIFEIIRLVIGFSIAIAGILSNMPQYLKVIITLLGYSILLYRTVKNAIKLLIKSRKINENFLITISTIGAYLVEKHMEGLMVITLYEIGKILESKAVNRTRKSISDLMDIRPEYANLKKNNIHTKVSPEEVKVGDIITIKHGEKVPLDGIVVSGNSILNTASLTGESIPSNVSIGDEVLSGSINEGDIFDIKVEATYKDSTVSKILELVENATDKKAKTETFVDKASKIYTPIVLGLAILVAVLLPIINKSITYNQSIYRALIFLVISCPCAIAISIPLCYFSGIGKSSKSGILVKGSNYIDAICNIKEIVFDKTGTLTNGKFEVLEIQRIKEDVSMDEIEKYLVLGERNSNHPIAAAIIKYVDKEYDDTSISDYKEIPGKGIEYTLDGKRIYIGFKADNKNEEEDLTYVDIAVNNEVVGLVKLEDSIKDDTYEAIKKIKKKGILTRIFTGDSKSSAEKVAKSLEIENVNFRMLPTDKYSEMEKIIKSYKQSNGKVAFVGDGINDSPVLALADVGISMGGLGAHSAIEASDVVIMTDSINKIDEAIDISKKTNRIIKENLIFAISVKVLILVLSTLGLCGMGFAVFADVGVTLITILNTLRILK